jgi:hypothetical protein
MAWLVVIVLLFLFLHYLLPITLAIGAAAMVALLLWIAWRLKWVILGIIGLEELFGGRDDM